MPTGEHGIKGASPLLYGRKERREGRRKREREGKKGRKERKKGRGKLSQTLI